MLAQLTNHGGLGLHTEMMSWTEKKVERFLSGQELLIRPARITDERALQELLLRESHKTGAGSVCTSPYRPSTRSLSTLVLKSHRSIRKAGREFAHSVHGPHAQWMVPRVGIAPAPRR